MVYNITNITSTTSFYGLVEYASNATSGLFFGVILTSLCIILIFNTAKYGIEQAVAASSFACLMISILLLYLNLINIGFTFVFAILLVGTLIFKVMSPSN